MQEKSGLRKDIIHIIEAGDLNALPEPRHAQFLIQQYADAVGLDHDKLKERFASDFPDDGDLNEKEEALLMMRNINISKGQSSGSLASS
ncbi:helix-turn-helix domain-containing protein [Salinicoccus sp. CNSTN-B1]